MGGRLRGTLGGWIVPLDRIEETLRTELQHPDFPREFPETTAGGQALSYIRDVWRRARLSPEGLANEVRDVLPTAYAYCLEDCANDVSLSERWAAAVPDAMVFAEREWIVLTEADDIYFDDIEDRRFSSRRSPVANRHGRASRPLPSRAALHRGSDWPAAPVVIRHHEVVCWRREVACLG